MKEDRLLRVARIVLRVSRVANIALMVAFAFAILLSWPMNGAITAQLVHKYGATLHVADVLLAMRLMLAAGIVASVALHRIFVALLAILATVRAGDPFTAANAARLQAIGWGLLVLQLLDLGLGGFTAWFAVLHVDFPGWSPSFGGWIAVMMVFVLARVFTIGARLRDDLAMTV